MLAGMSKDLIKNPAKWFVLETISNYLYDQLGALWKSTVMTALIAIVLRFYSTIPLDIRLIVGLFVLALAFFILERVIARRHNKQSSVVTSTAALGQATSTTEIATTDEQARNEIKRLQNDNEILQASISIQDKERESYKWLYELADQDKKFIDQRVKVIGCEIIGHDLLKELYVDFKFTIINASVYAVSIVEDSIKGDIYFNARILSKPNKIIENAARYFGHAEIKDFTVRQWLDRDEIADILNSSDDTDKFRLGGLDIMVKGGSDEAGVYPKKLNVYSLSHLSKPLRELCQKLDINILSASFRGFYPGGKISERGLRISINVEVTNPRPVRVTIQSFKLVTKINGIDYVAYAKEGEIRKGVEIHEGELLDWDSEKELDKGQELKNLNPSRGSVIILESKEPCGGWLQLDIESAGLGETKDLPATLVVIDTRGEEHPMECTLIYKSEG